MRSAHAPVPRSPSIRTTAHSPQRIDADHSRPYQPVSCNPRTTRARVRASSRVPRGLYQQTLTQAQPFQRVQPPPQLQPQRAQPTMPTPHPHLHRAMAHPPHRPHRATAHPRQPRQPPHLAATFSSVRRMSCSRSNTWNVPRLTSEISSSSRMMRECGSLRGGVTSAVDAAAEEPPTIASDAPAAPNNGRVRREFFFEAGFARAIAESSYA